jgi:hypothetical protein
MKLKHLLKVNGGEHEIEQGEHYGRTISYNPDDERFYVHAPGEGRTRLEDSGGLGVIGTFAADPTHRKRGWSNALQCARRASVNGDKLITVDPAQPRRLRHSRSRTKRCAVCNADACKEPWPTDR